MSYRSNKGRNNVTYLHKNKKNNSRTSKNKKLNKKRKINKAKLSILVLGILFFSFGTIKATQSVAEVVKNVSYKMGKNNDEPVVEAEKQFDLSEEQKQSNKKYTVFVDPGRGGDDKGLQSKTTKNYEKDITLEIGKRLASKLSNQSDINVIVSRSEDVNISTSERVNQAKQQKADFLVSLQLNSEYGGNTANGVEIYYKKDELYRVDELARYVQDSIVSYVDLKDRGIGIGDFGVLREATMPAIVIKCGFITNPEEEKKLTDEKFLNEFTEGIAQGILSYIDANK